MQNNPTFMPRESILEIEVKPNDVDGTFETNLHCSRNHCGETVHIDSNGPKTIQSVSCPKTGSWRHSASDRAERVRQVFIQQNSCSERAQVDRRRSSVYSWERCAAP